MNIPRATYRVQLHRDFGFADAAALVPYLAELGISHVYLSPWLKARPGSTHGYDIVDHGQLNPELGSDDDFAALAAALAAHGMGQMADIVPNHMGVMGSDNAWWLDVLENGRASQYAGYFDIDWTPPLAALSGKVLVPVLADNYGEVLLRGELQLGFDQQAGEFSVRYFQHRFPIVPRSYAGLLRGAAAPDAGAGDAAAHRLLDLANAFAALPTHDRATPRSIARRWRDKERLKRELAALVAETAEIGQRIGDAVARLNGRPGDAASFDALHALLEGQAFRLTSWRVAADDINYRRFFDINELAALRAEDPQVFADSHRLVLRLVAERKIDALRVDHPDGLYDPKAYFERLQAAVGAALLRSGTRRAQRGSPAPATALYTTVEKILAEHETLPADWPVQGTTGYRFANLVGGLWVDGAAKSRFDRVYAAFIGGWVDFDRILREAKLLIMSGALASDLNLLAHALTRIAEADRNTRDLTFNVLRRTLMLYTAALPVYRTYIDGRGPGASDLRYIDWAIGVARQWRPAPDRIAFDFLRQVLAGPHADAAAPLRTDIDRFARRLQQFTGPVMAKAMEDTSFYVYNRLVALNEVGGDPRRFGVSVAAFHAAAHERQRDWPGEMLATSTHDNKRSEDVRARIAVLSEMPAAWRLALRRWVRLNQRHETRLYDLPAPDRNDQYLLYQTLLGIWPSVQPNAGELDVLRQRVQAYMRKAIREAKVHSSWASPDDAYETALASFIDGLLGRLEPNPFLHEFHALHALVARCGLYNSLAQTVLKLTSPGVPDIYQGNELWDYSLVDPDNRRPVDYARRRALLQEIKRSFGSDGPHQAQAREMFGAIDDGRLKLYATWRALALRMRRPELFERGRYVALPVAGAHAAHICAFARVHEGGSTLTVVPRLLLDLTARTARPPLGAIWADTRIVLPSRTTYRDVLTGAIRQSSPAAKGARLAVAALFETLPVALLESTPAPDAVKRSQAGTRHASAQR
ncbi:MAG TPA: malto-oligosyltrehalose synthase [Casimicrobiaceae bacterium]|nr:malto-oligosyltrehalose synthase [Casimicrobiaceae bacterium]